MRFKFEFRRNRTADRTAVIRAFAARQIAHK